MGPRRAGITLLATATLLACQREAPAPPPSPPTPPPPDAAPAPPVDAEDRLGWAESDTIEIADVWNGLGAGWGYDLELHRRGDAFVGNATTWWSDRATIVLPADAIRALEAAAVRALAAHHPPPPYPNPHPGPWAHDPVEGGLVLTTGTTVTRLHYDDERRILLLDRHGVTTALDPPDPTRGQPGPMWAAYTRLLDTDLGYLAASRQLAR